MTTLYLLLGSNLGDRPAQLQAAREQIDLRVGALRRTSALYETAPWGITDQPAFLNQALEVLTDLAPEEVLRLILDIEHELGRVRYERWGARHLDVDILYFGTKVLDSARLTVPHPRLHERRFVLVPVAELAPDFVHPVFQKTNAQLLAECPDAGEVVRWESS
ncbi:2-amino-4-hydroxy-6-hydroxymethyldihydropteridine diphosphokinase [Rhabdobacter roseus]|uniref:2-amino-4-hydroxy-6-hydroxymethyldihydropteridine pyrophosphokinase n=1 Tax=Rhabdobacter roseus TaxID=1655419 RepID=A0A840U5M2_9BACT|nr:2-amino-4-hydroxy-6-hydroxymethyldihydropteridine diphosphokinase [Rhabdobacter roseus]MBB5287608.1 2-amino-4-hydroxy-6-hydroxymethyldihydropteridine diphosphokinase [Rhabdobacter roseus]